MIRRHDMYLEWGSWHRSGPGGTDQLNPLSSLLAMLGSQNPKLTLRSFPSATTLESATALPDESLFQRGWRCLSAQTSWRDERAFQEVCAVCVPEGDVPSCHDSNDDAAESRRQARGRGSMAVQTQLMVVFKELVTSTTGTDDMGATCGWPRASSICRASSDLLSVQGQDYS